MYMGQMTARGVGVACVCVCVWEGGGAKPRGGERSDGALEGVGEGTTRMETF